MFSPELDSVGLLGRLPLLLDDVSDPDDDGGEEGVLSAFFRERALGSFFAASLGFAAR